MDARAIAEVHVRGWKWAYRGQMPDPFLDSLSVERRTDSWRKTLVAPETQMRVWVAGGGDRVIGFAATGPPQDEGHPPSTVELQAIYLEGEVAGTGVGRALLTRAVDDLRERGFQSAYLWVLDTNERARRFYELAGWSIDGGTKTDQRDNFVLHEVRYRLELQP
jgi:GNAT superfamily N-acetyltransferase